jgi:L-threonylcarbamoyladenylate synthase
MRVAPPITPVIAAGPHAILEAGEILREGGLVAFPTETVYGLGANALDDFAVSAVFAAKHRPRFNPLIVHVRDQEEAAELVRFSPMAERLAEKFWPGALTLVLPRREPSALALLVSAGLDTVAVRSPSHTVARGVIEAAGVPIAAPSANRSGRVSATTASAVFDDLSGKIGLILDAGPSGFGLESTVVGFAGEACVLLRPGAIAREVLEPITGPLLRPTGGVHAPGMMASHYAPQAAMRLEARSVAPDEALLAFGPDFPSGAKITLNLSQSGDLLEASAHLFAMLRQLDAAKPTAIAVQPIPRRGLGEAINDRLARAAAPRQE